MVITIKEDFCLYQGASHKKGCANARMVKHLWILLQDNAEGFLDISTHFVKTSSSPPSLLLDSPSPSTNSFVGGTFNVFSLTKIWRKMCIYLFCNFSEELNCKGNVKSMYSDYASGIAFLIKSSSLIKWWKGWCHGDLCGALYWQGVNLVSWKFPIKGWSAMLSSYCRRRNGKKNAGKESWEGQ